MSIITPATQYVAVYGTLRPGERANHLWLGRGQHVGPAWLDGWELRDGGAFPFAIRSDDPARKIRVDVLRVDAGMLRVLDRYEGYPRLYDRVRVPVQVDAVRGPSNRLGLVSAWVYTPDDSSLVSLGVRSMRRVESGDWCDGRHIEIS